jgi:hypothetical protein
MGILIFFGVSHGFAKNRERGGESGEEGGARGEGVGVGVDGGGVGLHGACSVWGLAVGRGRAGGVLGITEGVGGRFPESLENVWGRGRRGGGVERWEGEAVQAVKRMFDPLLFRLDCQAF